MPRMGAAAKGRTFGDASEKLSKLFQVVAVDCDESGNGAMVEAILHGFRLGIMMSTQRADLSAEIVTSLRDLMRYSQGEDVLATADKRDLEAYAGMEKAFRDGELGNGVHERFTTLMNVEAAASLIAKAVGATSGPRSSMAERLTDAADLHFDYQGDRATVHPHSDAGRLWLSMRLWVMPDLARFGLIERDEKTDEYTLHDSTKMAEAFRQAMADNVMPVISKETTVTAPPWLDALVKELDLDRVEA